MHSISPRFVLMMSFLLLPFNSAQLSHEVCYVMEEGGSEKPIAVVQALANECLVSPGRIASLSLSHNASHVMFRTQFRASCDLPAGQSCLSTAFMTKLTAIGKTAAKPPASPFTPNLTLSVIMSASPALPDRIADFGIRVEAFGKRIGDNSHWVANTELIDVVPTHASNRSCGRKEDSIFLTEFTVTKKMDLLVNLSVDLADEEYVLNMTKGSASIPEKGQQPHIVLKTAAMGPKKLFDSRNVVSRNNGGKDLCVSGSLRLVPSLVVIMILWLVTVMIAAVI